MTVGSCRVKPGLRSETRGWRSGSVVPCLDSSDCSGHSDLRASSSSDQGSLRHRQAVSSPPPHFRSSPGCPPTGYRHPRTPCSECTSFYVCEKWSCFRYNVIISFHNHNTILFSCLFWLKIMCKAYFTGGKKVLTLHTLDKNPLQDEFSLKINSVSTVLKNA